MMEEGRKEEPEERGEKSTMRDLLQRAVDKGHLTAREALDRWTLEDHGPPVHHVKLGRSNTVSIAECARGYRPCRGRRPARRPPIRRHPSFWGTLRGLVSEAQRRQEDRMSDLENRMAELEERFEDLALVDSGGKNPAAPAQSVSPPSSNPFAYSLSHFSKSKRVDCGEKGNRWGRPGAFPGAGISGLDWIESGDGGDERPKGGRYPRGGNTPS
uniref:RevA n=1 Tax=Jembrana disease virus TaxID=36370 RepID=A7WZY2_JEMBR|nr:RevA [Jembrana disease virus]ABA41621.1 RevC [Jembrana disease virus]